MRPVPVCCQAVSSSTRVSNYAPEEEEGFQRAASKKVPCLRLGMDS